jgi:hypothetical protein
MTRTPNLISKCLILKLGAVIFAILWTAWMVCWSGFDDGANVIILSLCGAAAGYGWYHAMRWQFRRTGLLPQDAQRAG